MLTPRLRGCISHTCLWAGGFQRYRKSFKIGQKPFYSQVQSSSDYPAPDTPAIPIQWHFFEMIRSEKKRVQVQVPSVQ